MCVRARTCVDGSTIVCYVDDVPSSTCTATLDLGMRASSSSSLSSLSCAAVERLLERALLEARRLFLSVCLSPTSPIPFVVLLVLLLL